MLEYTSCEALMEIAFAGGCRPLHDYRSPNHSHTHSASLLIPPRRVLAIYLVDLLLDLEARFAALMGRIISSFAPSEKEARAVGTTPSTGARRCRRLAARPHNRNAGNLCMIIAPEFVE